MTYLLDVNVLIALIDRRHVFHHRAHRWFGEHGRLDWATCPTTQNGLIRIVGNPRYPNYAGPPGHLMPLLAQLTNLPGHRFWHDRISLLDGGCVAPDRMTRSEDVTDIYLVALAKSYGGRLATLDARMSGEAVIGGPEIILCLPAT